MSGTTHAAILVAVMSVVTVLLRFLPFWVFQKKTPAYVEYLGRVLPSAIIGMLVIYCLKDMKILSVPYGAPELIAALLVILLQAWKRNILLSIVAGTAVYMFLGQAVF